MFRLTGALVDALVAHGEADRAIGLLTDPAGDSLRDDLRAVLKKLGKADELRALVDRGDRHAVWDLAAVLRAQGRTEEAEALLTCGFTAERRVLPTGPAD
ncbi:hypothetical protein AQI88_29340 [Streptomyces cellostaticus]|uniref:Uncharacterized protein n=1 Tax=Streptomyces cellostaticus TaxID=67285 RepID=A0A101NH29_9ACTN|nr:hypothetical protein [Streptomyces cellostaticus]KUM92967.1 hypothetical protein AQI88_29340 [Streptomyces cellostaticus]GHI04686.1 hypothetical protein Scel_30070 [Streptomyces cellostaticus]